MKYNLEHYQGNYISGMVEDFRLFEICIPHGKVNLNCLKNIKLVDIEYARTELIKVNQASIA